MLRPRYKVVLEKDGVEVVDEDLARLLEEVERRGSILAAARATGLPYSRAWEKLVKAERILGGRLLETWRGGRGRGGARLTPLARRIIEEYRRAVHALGSLQAQPGTGGGVQRGFVAYSSDPVIELVLERIQGEGVEGACLGSSRSLAMLALGEADAACIHLYDPSTGTYNRVHLEQYQVEDPVRLGGYSRELVLAHRPGLSPGGVEDIIRGVAGGMYRMASRPQGSGTRLYLRHLAARVLGSIPRGWPEEYSSYVGWTHDDTARAVALGRADVALTLRFSAERYGLPSIHVAWEVYECYTTRAGVERVRPLGEALSSPWMRELASGLPGYRPDPSLHI